MKFETSETHLAVLEFFLVVYAHYQKPETGNSWNQQMHHIPLPHYHFPPDDDGCDRLISFQSLLKVSCQHYQSGTHGGQGQSLLLPHFIVQQNGEISMFTWTTEIFRSETINTSTYCWVTLWLHDCRARPQSGENCQMWMGRWMVLSSAKVFRHRVNREICGCVCFFLALICG